MKFSKLTLTSMIISSITMSMLTGCNDQSVQPSYNKAKMRSQHLVIKTHVQEEEIEAEVKRHHFIKLDNLNHSVADITLKNDGDKPLEISAINLEDKSHLFKLDKSKCPVTLEGHQSCQMTISFHGEEEARLEALVTISSNDRRRRNTLVSIIADGQNKHSGVLDAKNETSNQISPMLKLHFSLIDKKRFVNISNNGKDTLTLGKMKIRGDNKESFSFTNNCKTVLKIGESCEVQVDFKPTATGDNLAYLHIPSNGKISPSERVRLTGYSEPYNLEITNFVVAKNIHHFLGDYFNTNDTYYFRTMFQTNSDPKLEAYIDAELSAYFKANNLKIATTPNKASKVINLYPSITITPNEDNTDMDVSFVVNASMLSKSSTGGGAKASNNADINVTNHNFHVVPTLGEYVEDENLVFTLGVHATSYEDEYAVYKKIADIMSARLFNIIGLKDNKED